MITYFDSIDFKMMNRNSSQIVTALKKVSEHQLKFTHRIRIDKMSALLRCKKNDEIEIRKVEQLLQSILQLETEVDDDCSYNLRALDFVDQWPSLEFKL